MRDDLPFSADNENYSIVNVRHDYFPLPQKRCIDTLPYSRITQYCILLV